MTLLSYETSQNMLNLLQVDMLRTQNVALNMSLGRILAEDIVAEFDEPRFLTASMDGYAVIHEDLSRGKITILGDNPAGSDEKRVVKSGECIKTFTGSKMPFGADTLIQIELVSVEDGTIIINKTVPKGSSVRPVAESFSAGATLIQKGTKIGFAEIGVMASLNKVMVKVALKPRVAVISTGSEILDLGVNSSNDSQIRSSNNYTLAALFEQAGTEVVQLGTVGDDRVSITKAFQNALACADIIVSTGGVSVGDYDFVKDIVPRLGAEIVFKGVAIKPGKHILVAQKNEKFVVALPGFAYSSSVTAILYVLPLISKMLGRENSYRMVEAKLSENFSKRSSLREFSACNVEIIDGEYFVNFKDKKVGSSAILTNLLHGSALMVSGEDDGDLQKDTLVNVILVDSF